MKVRAAFVVAPALFLACAAPGHLPAVEATAAPSATSVSSPVVRPVAASEADAAVPIRANNPTWGDRAAPVTIVEFSDFQCPYCQNVQTTLLRLRETYGPDTLRIVWKDSPLPFHAQARAAAQAAAGVFALAGSDAFWRFHDLLFHNQSALGPDAWEQWAKEAGVTRLDALRSGLQSGSWADAVDADLRDGRALGVEGTPTFFVNGVAIVGAQEFAAFQAVVDEQVRAAHAKRAAGTPPDLVYAQLARENRANPPKSQDEEEAETEDTQTVFKIPVGNSPTLGNPNALVTIVEFSDFQCPFCEHVEPTLKAIRDKYGDRVRLVWKNEVLPFHPRAEPAAQAALEVRAAKGNAAFWRVHDALFANQQDLSEETLVQLATQAGARSAAVKKAIAAHTHAREIEADADLVDDFQANGTPHFFLNGRRLVGAQPQERFEKIIDEEIEKAKSLIAGGTKPSAVYEALLKDGKTAPAPETRDLSRSLPSNGPSRGNPSARVTVHEWSDFQCPFCERVEHTLGEVMKAYGDRIRFVWHDLPLPMHRDAPLAAEAGREAFRQKGERAFWALHDKMFSHQDRLKRDDLDGYARDLSLDPDTWRAALDGSTHSSDLDADRKAAEDMGIRGTPAFVVVPSGGTAGYLLSGAQPYAKFRKIVDRALLEAK